MLKIKQFSVKNAVIISSDPRGGSTWLMEIFNTLPFTVINFEPLYKISGVAPTKFNLGWYPYVPKENSDKQLYQFFYNVFSYRIYNRWTTSFVSLKKLIRAKIVVTKFVLANQLLPWFVTKFNGELKYKPIYLVRHPIPTCMSQLKTFHKIKEEDLFKPLSGSLKFVAPNCNFNERFITHETYINSLDSKMERHIALWCINNGNLLNHEDSNKWLTLYYENLVRDPFTEVTNLFKVLGIEFSSADWKKFNFQKPSYSDFNKEYKYDPIAQLQSYLQKFSNENLQKLQVIFDYFNITDYSAFDPYPLRKR